MNNIEYNNLDILTNNQYTRIDARIANVSATDDKVTWANMIDFGNFSLGVNPRYEIHNGQWDEIVNLLQTLVTRIEALENGTQIRLFTVRFDTGDSFTERTINEGNPIGTLPIPTKTGYTFIGWFTNITGGSQINANTIINEDVTYYAHWNSNQYTVTLTITNGAKNPNTNKTVNHGESASWTITPDSGYKLPTTVNGATISGNTLTVSNVTSNKQINVTCLPISDSQYYFYVGTVKPTLLSQATAVTSYPAEQTYTNSSGAKSHIFVLTNSDKTVTFINPELNSPVSQFDVDTTTISGYKIFETRVGTANGKSIKITIS